MIDVGFYHCTRQPASVVAVKLAARAVASGERLLVVGAAEQLAALDVALWAEEGFLAHGLAGGTDDAAQPILLAERLDANPGAAFLMLLETGLPPEFDAFRRVFNLFDDATDAHTRARSDWKAISGREGVTRAYWQQRAGGGWEKKA